MTLITKSETQGIQDRLEIIELTSQLLLRVDARDWAAAEELFTSHVDVDYTSLTGGEPSATTPRQLVAGWRQTLEPLQATQHLQGNHVVSLDGETATCATNVQATHVLPNPMGDSTWTIGGRYDFTVARTPSGWRISGMTLTVKWTTGNQKIMELATSG